MCSFSLYGFRSGNFFVYLFVWPFVFTIFCSDARSMVFQFSVLPWLGSGLAYACGCASALGFGVSAFCWFTFTAAILSYFQFCAYVFYETALPMAGSHRGRGINPGRRAAPAGYQP